MRQQSSPKHHKKEVWNLGGTLNELSTPSMVLDNQVIASQNFPPHYDGRSRIKRGGCAVKAAGQSFAQNVWGLFHFRDTGGNLRWIVITSKKILISDITDFDSYSQLYYQETVRDAPFKPVTFESGRPIIVGFDKNLYIDTETPASPAAYQLGIDKPSSAPSVAVGAAGNLTGDFKYLITYYKSGNFPYESNPSVESDVVSPSSQKVDLTNIPVSSDPQVDKKRIYRTKANGAIFYWLADIANATTSYEDNIADDSLGDEVSYDRYKPPKAEDVEVWDGRVWFLVPSENRIYYTNPGEEAERGNLNFLLVEDREPERITGMKVFGENLYVFKESNSMFRINKIGDSYYEVEKLPFRTGCDARASIAATDDLLIWKSKKGIELYNGNRVLMPRFSRFIDRTFKGIRKDKALFYFGEINDKTNQYWLTFAESGQSLPNKVIVFDLVTNAFDVFSFYNKFLCFANVIDDSSNNLWLAGATDFKIYDISGAYYSDAGQAITSYFQTRYFPVGTDEGVWNILHKLLVKFILKNDGATKKHLKLEIFVNNESTAALTHNFQGNDVSDDLRNEVLRVINTGVKGAYMSFKFSNNEVLVGRLKVMGFEGYFQERILKRDIYGS